MEYQLGLYQLPTCKFSIYFFSLEDVLLKRLLESLRVWLFTICLRRHLYWGVERIQNEFCMDSLAWVWLGLPKLTTHWKTEMHQTNYSILMQLSLTPYYNSHSLCITSTIHRVCDSHSKLHNQIHLSDTRWSTPTALRAWIISKVTELFCFQLMCFWCPETCWRCILTLPISNYFQHLKITWIDWNPHYYKYDIKMTFTSLLLPKIFLVFPLTLFTCTFSFLDLIFLSTWRISNLNQYSFWNSSQLLLALIYRGNWQQSQQWAQYWQIEHWEQQHQSITLIDKCIYKKRIHCNAIDFDEKCLKNKFM